MNAFELKAVSKRYRTDSGPGLRSLRRLRLRGSRTFAWALRDVDLVVPRGETLGLIGGNGSGKSTLLRIMAGLTRPSSGAMSAAGRVRGLLTLGEGLHPLMTGAENARTGAMLAGLTRREANRRLDQVADFSELGDHFDHELRTYSDGMRLRLAFAISIHVDPEILLVDEVLAVGDLRFQEKCLVRLEELRQRGVTTVLTSHVLPTVKRLCPRVVWLDSGRVTAMGDADEVLGRYEDHMHASGPPPRNLGGGGIRKGTGEVEVVDVRLVDRTGATTGTIVASSAVGVEIDFVAHSPVGDAIFHVGVHTAETGTSCLDLSTADEGLAVGPLRGPGTVRLDLDRLDLAAGLYHLDVGVFEASWDRTFDYLWQATSFEVVGPPGGGVLRPPNRWRMPITEPADPRRSPS